MKKVLHVCTGMAWRGGDAGMLTVVNLLKDHPEQEHHIFCAENSEVEKRCKEHHIRYYSFKRGRKFSPSYMRAVKQTVVDHDYDVLHAQDSNALTMALVTAPFMRNVKIITTRKRNNPLGKNPFKTFKYNNPSLKKIICLSESVKSVLVPVVKNHSKIQVIYDGIPVSKYSAQSTETDLYKELSINEHKKIVGVVAGLVDQKDLKTFIRAAAILKAKSNGSISFVIAGTGPKEDELKAYAQTKNMMADIHFLGFRNDIPQLLKAFDVFMLSSVTEGLPIVVMEAFASGTPVVSTDAGGTREALLNGKNGFIVPIGDYKALAERTFEVLSDESLKGRFVKNAMEEVRKNFDISVMRANYERFYASL